MYCENIKCIFWNSYECNFTECACTEEDEFEGLGRG